jgi:glyoxylase-like metal-dependent hydrolase (beta-lactamase superfamily II)
MQTKLALLFVAALWNCAPAIADSSTTKQRSTIKLADNVYEIRHPDAPDGFPQSNTTVIIGERGVMVIDSCLLPSTARADVEQIRRWTTKPVTHLLNTHWHFDHTLGNQTYADAYPGVQVIAQQHTQKVIRDFNPGAVARYPGRAQRFKKILDSGRDSDGKPLSAADRKDYEHALDGLAPVVEEFKTVTQLVPNVVFDSEMDIDLGGMLVQLRFLGRGNTGGDTIAYLPKQKILITGDLVDHPVPYFFGGFPADQVTTLDRLAAFDATTIVPGHGDVLRDKSFIFQMQQLLQAVNAEIEKQINDGKTLEETQDIAPKNLDVAGWRRKFAGDDADSQTFFDQSFSALIKAAYNQIKMR